MKSYVISLSTAQIRREHIIKEFSKYKIEFEFFDALKPSDDLNLFIQKYIPNLLNANFSEVEKACFMSHISLWLKCIKEDFPYMCIFEDDVILGKDASLFFTSDYWLKERFNFSESWVIHLETFLNPTIMEKHSYIKPYKSREFRRLESFSWGAAGYIVSKAAIQNFLERFTSLSSEELEPIDNLILYKYLNFIPAYQLLPAICIQEIRLNQLNPTIYSQLENDRLKYKEKLGKPKKTIKDRFVRIYSNIIRALGKPWRKKKKVIDFL